ncbi:MAG: amidohydrolase/deacetylase family metallohydrolase [Flavobacterium sp.]|nr:amidohydrolase/deacetylase family metallohydrolase [Pseudozobellia sp.]MBF01152.1 amidohydrolase/deacetylase family metallohydrolase [Flavobacterium sp.]MBG47939.1 amidohydrolase/deacetylase family metallohydrolase [Pseudozobellia sp.]|tara:strand:+ start:876375 stop:877610 length:1236 start_codon:yes stop_codon:yes gene_type:complete
MKKQQSLLIIGLLLCLNISWSQEYSIVIKGGHVIDPKNSIDEVLDVAIKDNKIVKVAKNINAKDAEKVVEAKGLYVTPGLIDIHQHVFAGTEAGRAYSNGPGSVAPDGFSFRTGITTVVDCGGSGWKSFPTFKENIIDRSKTRVLAFLNIVGEGMRGGNYEQDTNDMNAKLSAQMAQKYSDDIVGFKVAHYEGPDWTPVDRAVEAGNLSKKPVIIDFGGSQPPLSIEELFMQHLRPGDIYTHAFAELETRETVVDVNSKELKPFVSKAQEKGIVFDVGYGGISFAYSQAIPAVKSGFYPNTISTDLHIGSMNNAMKDLLSVMSKFLVMGMELEEVIKATTWNPAKAILREELGNLSADMPADVAILRLNKGDFGYFDYTGHLEKGKVRLECELTIRDGKVVYDLNGRSLSK